MHYTILLFGINSLAITHSTPHPPFLGCVWRPNIKGGSWRNHLGRVCSRLRRCKTVGRMPMQNHMWAKIRDNNSISYAWILAPCWHQFGARCSCLMSGFLHCCCYASRYQARTFHVTIRHSIIARAFFGLENDLHSKACNVTQTYTCSTQILVRNIFLVRNCVGQHGS